MKTSQKTLLTMAIVTALCILLVAVVTAAAPPPDVVTIDKTVSPQLIERDYTGVLTYTIVVTNNHTETVEMGVVDTLPTALSFGDWVTQGEAIVVGDTITWTGSISATESVTIAFTAELPEDMTLLVSEGEIVNTAELGYLEDTAILPYSSDSATTRFYRYIFLPLVMRNFTP